MSKALEDLIIRLAMGIALLVEHNPTINAETKILLNDDFLKLIEKVRTTRISEALDVQ